MGGALVGAAEGKFCGGREVAATSDWSARRVAGSVGRMFTFCVMRMRTRESFVTLMSSRLFTLRGGGGEWRATVSLIRSNRKKS
jgi:hypothetical protein